MMPRVALGALGVATGLYGAWLLLTRQDRDQVLDVAVWLAAGVLVHDVLLSAVVVLAGALGARLLSPAWRAPVTAGLVVVATVTVVAVPVLGRFGARADNPTLLDRDYVAGWLVLVAVVAAVVVAAALLRARRTAPEGG